MNKKVIALIAVILVIVVLGIIVGINYVSNNNEVASQNQTQTQNQSNRENQTNNNAQANNQELGQIANNATNTNENQNNEVSGNGKALVVYFSHTGNTETVANFIHEAVGGDIVKLETVEPYTDNYNDLLDIAQEERNENARPELSTHIDNIDEYDTIFLGYPIWWGDMPMAVYSFLDEYDLSGKTIAPFVTSGGSGLSGTPSDIEDEEPNATVTEGLSIRDSNVRNSQSEVEQWLSQIGF